MEKEIIQLLDVIMRALLSLITLFLVTKFLGKKQVSQLSLFDYVIGISIGNFAAEMTINLESEYLHGIMAVIIFGIVSYGVSILTMKSFKSRKFFMGRPTILIQNGKLLIESLKDVKFDINDLLEQCRINGYFDISQINYAVMETNGQISFLPKSQYQPVTIKDINKKGEETGLFANVIIDGHFMKHAITNIGVTEYWLKKQIKMQGKELQNILLATVDINKNLQIYEKNAKERVLDVLE